MALVRDERERRMQLNARRRSKEVDLKSLLQFRTSTTNNHRRAVEC